MNIVFDFFSTNPLAAPSMIIVAAILNLLVFIFLGKRAESQFRDIKLSDVEFREKGVSGYSKKSKITKFGGASKVLDIIVTDTELCIKGIYGAFTFIGTKYDLTRRTPLKHIKDISEMGSEVEISFYEENTIVLRLNDVNGFIAAIKG